MYKHFVDIYATLTKIQNKVISILDIPSFASLNSSDKSNNTLNNIMEYYKNDFTEINLEIYTKFKDAIEFGIFFLFLYKIILF